MPKKNRQRYTGPSKGGTRGQRNGNAKLSNRERDAIKKKLANGERGVNLAQQYGVTPAEISQIKTGKRFSKKSDAE